MNYSCSWLRDKTYAVIPHPVRIAQVENLNLLSRVYTGVVEADEYADLAFKISGPLIEMNVDAGQSVRKGTVIAVMDPLDYQSRYDAARAAYVTARSQLERDKRLLSMQAISRQEYETAQAAYVRARSAYLIAENTLNDTRLVAPFPGFIEQKFVENYQKVQAGESVVRLVNPVGLSVRFILPETSVRLIRNQTGVRVQFDTYPDEWFEARVSEVVDASPGGGGIPVKVVVEDSLFSSDRYKVYPGFSARVKVFTENSVPDSYLVPLSALFENLSADGISLWKFRREDSVVVR
ncbi:MAG: efflux RND transporter periplasmic adaptor subunit, partial [Odoribacter sp.]|nr:efflux RND transporter periplasmic adaptor subunit [Odoribacter sp.]